MDTLRCSSCGASRDADDNFCRRCGRQITVNLPAIRQGSLPAESRGVPPSLVGSVALLALGTGLEWLARRAAGGAARTAARAAGKAITKRDQTSSRAAVKADPETPAAMRIDEVVYIRQVHIR
jgi:hypothetical protein